MIQPFSPLPRPGSFLPFLISGQCIAQLVSILYLFAFSVEIGHVTLPLLLSLSLSLFLLLHQPLLIGQRRLLMMTPSTSPMIVTHQPDPSIQSLSIGIGSLSPGFQRDRTG